VAASAAVILGSALASAPTASAVGSDGCDKNITNQWRHVDDLGGGIVRSGPAAAYSQRYTMNFGYAFYAVCSATNTYGNLWYYGRDYVGDRWGWIYSQRTAKGWS
jgi:hypothetical protein